MQFIHKLFQLSHVAPAGRVELVEVYIKRCREWLHALRSAEAMLEPALKGPNAENAWFQLLSLRHLCRIVECEADSARQIADEIRDHSRTSVKRPGKVARFPGKRGFRRANAVAERLTLRPRPGRSAAFP